MGQATDNAADVIIVGAGLAGLVAAAELGDRGKRVILLDQEPAHFLGGQAHWSLGGLFMIDTPEQRRMGIRDRPDLARRDWFGSAQFDRPEDHWPQRWARAYLEFASGEMRAWLHGLGMRWFPVVGWAERGGGEAEGHGNSVPRFHLTWGTGPGVVAPFAARVEAHVEAGLIQPRFRHQVSHIITQGGIVKGVSGEVLAEDQAPQGARTNRQEIGEFEVYAPSVLVASGGIGGNLDAVRKNWPVERLGPAPRRMVAGVPFHVDGRMIPIAEAAGGHVINADRMWHYTEGLRNWDPIWPNHGIRILPGPSSMWFDARGDRLPAPYLPGFDTLGTLRDILKTGQDYSWFILSQKIIQKEFALSGSEQNPDLTSGKWGEVLRARLLSRGKAPAPVEAFKKHGADFVVADTLSDLVKGMNELGELPLEETHLRRQIEARDAQADNPFAKDAQLIAINAARNYRGDRLIRTAKPHRLLDRANGPLIAVRLNILTRKSLGGLQTNLDGQMIGADGSTVPGLFAAGEVAGFGGGGYHGYNALEGSFLGGCLFTGRQVGQSRAIA
ncbi:FAD-binding dehydrogenase [Phaeobacter gallaeciensis]|uniref:Fumarate reductase/succinate dehydrogenase flavoprotein-like protein n=1 Tax=Phaeobacter gallaeciensis TaxID=60890 RepID=A0AAD0EC98_9RHOB|nr:FAD-binding dehydrogenase [Phaeobacter gallaeciensis]AHD08991.1 putative oxidoreductase [Phaeobacter gallaeciensis DSM 26640]ATE92257.1 fumarate reductase/succinate dehydrogenase flavoprotein-like protein [Phaeobacter gallaeciensis]ATE97924.1 fumarate reductase/succinate dehydrogenase flavoprotein-like protein [Phaeobacter gallaeciensis]ATF00919.1 fumarate reductase/succinate dehydrogenase flavoprotein-like protein [Phaeobacter gallaeciensis]ATF05299.1 fumarate reductase/succinate dehydroge